MLEDNDAIVVFAITKIKNKKDNKQHCTHCSSSLSAFYKNIPKEDDDDIIILFVTKRKR